MKNKLMQKDMENTIQNIKKASPQTSEKLLENSLHLKFTLYGKNAREWMRKCAMLLPEIEKREIWKKHGFLSIYEYAAKLAGMSHSSVRDALRIMKKVEDKPELKEIIKEKGINAIRPVVSIATQETADFWAGKVRELSKNTLEEYVREFKKSNLQAKINDQSGTSTTSSQIQELFSEKEIIQMKISPKIADKLKKLKGNGNWDELMQKFIELHEKELEQNKPQPVQAEKRYVKAAIKKHALAKTNGTCAFPGCIKPHAILHHTERFALTHTHDPNTLIPLCKNHERIAHSGLIENENLMPEEWKIALQQDTKNEKYEVDRWVQKYRRSG